MAFHAAGKPDTSGMSMMEMQNLAIYHHSIVMYIDTKIRERLGIGQDEGAVAGSSGANEGTATQGFQTTEAEGANLVSSTNGLTAPLPDSGYGMDIDAVTIGPNEHVAHPELEGYEYQGLTPPTSNLTVSPYGNGQAMNSFTAINLPGTNPIPVQQVITPLVPVMKTAQGSSFDPFWQQKEGHDDAQIAEAMNFRTKLKFDCIFTHKALRAGDVISIDILVPGNAVHTESQVHLKARSKTGVPTFDVTVNHLPYATSVLADCTGPNMIEGWLKEHGFLVNNMSKNFQQSLQIYREGVYLCDYHYFKLAYHLWVEKRDAEAKQAGVEWRTRRGKDKDDGVTWGEKMRQPW